jgi:hypothetical protein
MPIHPLGVLDLCFRLGYTQTNNDVTSCFKSISRARRFVRFVLGFMDNNNSIRIVKIMRNISSKMLLWIGATAAILFIVGVLVTNQVKQGMLASAVDGYRLQVVASYNGTVQEKLIAGVGGAVSIATSQTVKTNVALQDHEVLAEVLNQISDSYAKKTDNKNIQFLIVDADGNFLLRTYVTEPDTGRGKDATYRAGIKEILAGTKSSHMGIDLSSGGLVLSSMVGVEVKGKPVGVL